MSEGGGMNDGRDVIVLRVDRKSGAILAGVLLTVLGGFAMSEQLTLTTSYPAPSGIYNQIVTTGNSGSIPVNTVLNRNAGSTLLVPPGNLTGRVGIGVNDPSAKLSVAGGVQLGDETTACTASMIGTLRWHSNELEACDGTQWAGMGGGVTGPVIYQCPPNPGNIGGGAWGFYGCQGQITTQAACTTIEYPNSASYPCTRLGTLLYMP